MEISVEVLAVDHGGYSRTR